MSRASLAALLLAARFAAAEPIAMADAIARGLAHNRDLAAAALQLGASDLSVSDAWNEFAWTLAPDGGLARTEDGATSRLGLTASRRTLAGTILDGGLSAVDNGADATTRRTGALRINLRQPLLRGRGGEVNRDGILRAESSRRTARRSFEERRAALVLAIVQAHQDLAQAQQQQAFDGQALERYEQLQRLTSTRERQGRASRVDTLRVEYQLGQARLGLAETVERVASLRRDLCELVGAPLDTPLEAAPVPALEIPDAAPALAEALALANRLDYAEALQAVSEARRGIRVARDRVLPAVDLVAGYGREGRGETFRDAMALDEDETWTVGLAGDTDLHRRAERSALRRTLLDAAAAEEALAALESRIRREVQQAVLAYERARAQAAFAGQNVELARRRALLARRLFELGRGDNFTATDAEAELLRAQSQTLSTEAEAAVAAYRLKRATGTLVESPEELRPPVPAAGREHARE